MKTVERCSDCNTATYNMNCIRCYANWILRFDKPERLAKIESNGRHEIESLKKEIMKRAK